MFRRRQRLFVEMEQMASRPFSQVKAFISMRAFDANFDNFLHHFVFTQVLVEIDSKDREYNEITPALENNTATKKRKKDSPSPIALEPCCGNKAAVLSLLVRMPTGKFLLFDKMLKIRRI